MERAGKTDLNEVEEVYLRRKSKDLAGIRKEKGR